MKKMKIGDESIKESEICLLLGVDLERQQAPLLVASGRKLSSIPSQRLSPSPRSSKAQKTLGSLSGFSRSRSKGVELRSDREPSAFPSLKTRKPQVKGRLLPGHGVAW